jgi:tetratricopeptide (TPR) repeat protein
MINYYDVLGVEPDSPIQEIKRSFRRKAKELHPDLRPGDGQAAAEMRLLLRAYEVLSDAALRGEHDRTLRGPFTSPGFDYREFLRRRPHDPVSQARLVFHDLLADRGGDAVALYDSLVRRPGFLLEHYLSREDYMDCAFLLAEVLENQGRLAEAWSLYVRLFRLERERPYFRHFIDEVIDRLRILTCAKMAARLPAADTIARLKELIRMGFSHRDTAVFYKKLAEAYASLGRNDLALHYLGRGLQYDRKLAGVKKLMERIGYPVWLDNP